MTQITNTYTPTVLEYHPNAPQVLKSVTIAADEDLQPGTILGRVTASGEYIAHDIGAGDGSEVPVGVLAQRVDNSDSIARPATMYDAGDFFADNLNVGGVQLDATTHAATIAAFPQGAAYLDYDLPKFKLG